MLDRGHPFFPTFERLMADAAAHKPVYDLGTNGRFAKEIGLVRHLFEESTYKAGGYRPERIGGSNGCDFHCDIQDLNGIADQSIGSVVSLSVLEHVVNPLRAVQEIARILRAVWRLFQCRSFTVTTARARASATRCTIEIIIGMWIPPTPATAIFGASHTRGSVCCLRRLASRGLTYFPSMDLCWRC